MPRWYGIATQKPHNSITKIVISDMSSQLFAATFKELMALEIKKKLLSWSKKSPTGPTEWTPQAEYLIARSNLLRGPWWNLGSVEDTTFQLDTLRKLTNLPWKMVVGRWNSFQRDIRTLPATNSSHLKIDGWETSLSFWVSAYFQVLLLLVSGRVILAGLV